LKKPLVIFLSILFLLLSLSLFIFNLGAENQIQAQTDVVASTELQTDANMARPLIPEIESMLSLDKLIAFGGFSLVIVLAFFSWSRSAPRQKQPEK